MCSILDIDLDYFNQLPEPGVSLEHLLNWAGRPVSMVMERHNHAFARWRTKWRTHNIILHVDKHHDMMDQRPQTNIANFMFHAMRVWPQCRVHWLVQYPIDSPDMWLEDEMWDSFRSRFTHGPHRPARWPKPDLVSVCTSPDFVSPNKYLDKINLTKHPKYSAIIKKYPRAVLWFEGNLEKMVKSADGGQRFIWRHRIFNGCHSCEIAGTATVAYDFDKNGKYNGVQLLKLSEEDLCQ